MALAIENSARSLVTSSSISYCLKLSVYVQQGFSGQLDVREREKGRESESERGRERDEPASRRECSETTSITPASYDMAETNLL